MVLEGSSHDRVVSSSWTEHHAGNAAGGRGGSLPHGRQEIEGLWGWRPMQCNFQRLTIVTYFQLGPTS